MVVVRENAGREHFRCVPVVKDAEVRAARVCVRALQVCVRDGMQECACGETEKRKVRIQKYQSEGGRVGVRERTVELSRNTRSH